MCNSEFYPEGHEQNIKGINDLIDDVINETAQDDVNEAVWGEDDDADGGGGGGERGARTRER